MKFERIEGALAIINGRFVTNTETDELKETILNQKIDRIEQIFFKELLILNFNLENYKSRTE